MKIINRSFSFGRSNSKRELKAPIDPLHLNIFCSGVVSSDYVLRQMEEARSNCKLVKIDVEDLLVDESHQHLSPAVKNLLLANDRDWESFKYIDSIPNMEAFPQWQRMKHDLMQQYDAGAKEAHSWKVFGALTFSATIQLPEGTAVADLLVLLERIEGDEDITKFSFSRIESPNEIMKLFHWSDGKGTLMLPNKLEVWCSLTDKRSPMSIWLLTRTIALLRTTADHKPSAPTPPQSSDSSTSTRKLRRAPPSHTKSMESVRRTMSNTEISNVRPQRRHAVSRVSSVDSMSLSMRRTKSAEEPPLRRNKNAVPPLLRNKTTGAGRIPSRSKSNDDVLGIEKLRNSIQKARLQQAATPPSQPDLVLDGARRVPSRSTSNDDVLGIKKMRNAIQRDSSLNALKASESAEFKPLPKTASVPVMPKKHASGTSLDDNRPPTPRPRRAPRSSSSDLSLLMQMRKEVTGASNKPTNVVFKPKNNLKRSSSLKVEVDDLFMLTRPSNPAHEETTSTRPTHSRTPSTSSGVSMSSNTSEKPDYNWKLGSFNDCGISMAA